MNDLTCSEIADLLAAYVLDAMDGDERCALLEHLAECRLHDIDLQAERGAALMLAGAVPEVAPPPALRASLLDAFDKERAGGQPEAAPQHVPVPEPEPVRLPERRKTVLELLRAPTFAYGIAAALAVLALGLGAWGLSRGDGGKEGIRLAAARATDMRLDVTYLPDRNLAVLNFDMPTPAIGKTYQAWQIVDGAPVSLGVLSQNSGTVTFAANLDRAQAVAISIEPAGGSKTPTTVAIASNF